MTDTDLTAVVGAGATALGLTLTAGASGGGASVSGTLHLIQITNASNPPAVKSWLGVDASACVAVEDSSNGLRSAHASGAAVVAVPHPRYPPDVDALATARLVLAGLDGLTVDAVREL